jgi:hypothetical protein
MITATNKRLLISESRGDSNRCTPCRGKPGQRTTYAFHATPHMPSVHFLLAIPVRGNLSWVIDRVEQAHYFWEKGLPTQSSVPADRSVSPYPVSLSSQPMKQWGQRQASIDDRLLCLLGPYHQHATGTFNTCSCGPTYRYLTDTGRGYNLGGGSLPHTTLQSCQPALSTFHLRAPPDLQFNQILSTKPKRRV